MYSPACLAWYAHPADPTLTTENFMEVVKGLERRWMHLAVELVVQHEKIAEIKRTYPYDIQRMEAVVDHYVRYKPNRSWEKVASALQRIGLHQQGSIVTTKYIRGI